MVLLGWLLFRRPGVEFWTFAPVWRANQYLKLPGTALWVAGLLVGLAGVVLHDARDRCLTSASTRAADRA